jgi:DNA-binding NtrC family response regulator
MNNKSQAPVLIAIPDEWQSVCQFLETKGIATLPASSYDEALNIIQAQQLRGLVTISDWAIAEQEGQFVGLIELVKGKIPSVTLTRTTRADWFDIIYDPPYHQFCTIPFALDELLGFMKRARMV